MTTDPETGPTTPRPFTADEPTTLVEVFEQFARTHKRPDTLNYKHNGKWVSISSDELLSRARSIAAGLYSLGVRRGERVAILSESRPNYSDRCRGLSPCDHSRLPTLMPPQSVTS